MPIGAGELAITNSEAHRRRPAHAAGKDGHHAAVAALDAAMGITAGTARWRRQQ